MSSSPPVPLAAFVSDLQAPGVSLTDAEELLVELIQTRRSEGVERWKIGKEIETVVREIPAHLVPALTPAKERTLLFASYLSAAAFAIASSRPQVVKFLRDAGSSNPALAREVLLEYVAKKEFVVQGWPGGVRAAVEVVQGALRDVGVELGHLPIASAVESVQLETGHVSISGLMRFLRTLAPAATVVGGQMATKAASAAAAEALSKGEMALRKWAEVSLLSGASRWELRMELNEIQSQLPVVLQPIFPPLHSTLRLSTQPICPEAHGIACIPSQILPAFQRRSDPDFVREVLMEWVGWERRRCPDVWGRKRRGEMGLKLVEMENVVIEKLALGHLSSVFQLVRFHSSCPPVLRPTSPKREAFVRLKSVAAQRNGTPPSAVDAADAGPLRPYNIAAILSLVPRTLTDAEVETMLDRYIGEEKRKSVFKGKGAAGEAEGDWAEADRKRVADILDAMVEKLNDPTVTLLLQAAAARWDLPARKMEVAGQHQVDNAPDDPNLTIMQGFLSPPSSVYDHDTTPAQPLDLLTPATSAFTSPAASSFGSPSVSVQASPAVSPKVGVVSLPGSPVKARVPIGIVDVAPSPNVETASTTTDAAAAWTPPVVDIPKTDDPEEAVIPSPTPSASVETVKKRGLFGTLFGAGSGAPKPGPKTGKPPKRRPGAVPQSTSRRRSSTTVSSESLTLVEVLKTPPPSQPSSPRTSVRPAAVNRTQSMHEPSPSSSRTTLTLTPHPSLHQRSLTATAFPPQPNFVSAPIDIPAAAPTSGASSESLAVPSPSSGSTRQTLSPETARRPRVLKKRSSSASTSSRNSRASAAPEAVVDTSAPTPSTGTLSKADKAKADKAAKAQKKVDDKAARKAVSKKPTAASESVAVASPPVVSSAPVISQPMAMRSTPEVNHLRPASFAAGTTPQSILNAQAERRERRRSMVELGTFADDAAGPVKNKKRFTIFGSWSGKKDMLVSPPLLQKTEPSYRPTSEVIFDDTTFPPWTLPPPHRMGSPPKHNLALTPTGSPGSSPIDGPWNRRNSWRMSTASYGGGLGGTSTPPIQEVDGEHGSPGDGRRNSPLSSTAEIADYLGQQLFEREPVGLGLLGSFTTSHDAFSSSRSPAPDASQNSLAPVHEGRRRMLSSGSSFRVSNPDQPSRRPSSVSFDLGVKADSAQRRLSDIPPTPVAPAARLLDTSGLLTVNSPSVLGSAAGSAPPPVETHSNIVRQIEADIMQGSAAAVDGLPSTPLGELAIAVDSSSAAPTTTPEHVAEALAPTLNNPVAAHSDPSAPSSSPAAPRILGDPTLAASLSLFPASLAPRAADSALASPPVLSLRGVFDALPAGHLYSSGHVLDILMGFIDREREKALAFDKKRGWGEPQRDKVGWFLNELEESLLPDNPHLTTTFQRVKALTDCPPQTKVKSKRHQSLSSRSRRRQESTSSAVSPEPPTTARPSSPARSETTSLSSATTASYLTETDNESIVSDSSADSFSSDATVTLAVGVAAAPATAIGHDVFAVDLEGQLNRVGQTSNIPADVSLPPVVENPDQEFTRPETPTPRGSSSQTADDDKSPPAARALRAVDTGVVGPSPSASHSARTAAGSEWLSNRTYSMRQLLGEASSPTTTMTPTRSRSISGHEHTTRPSSLPYFGYSSPPSSLDVALGGALPSPPEAPPPYERNRTNAA